MFIMIDSHVDTSHHDNNLYVGYKTDVTSNPSFQFYQFSLSKCSDSDIYSLQET